MINEAIILAGGLGTRLQSVVSDLPKSLAPVAGKPFLSYVLDNAIREGVQQFVFALGYKTEQIELFVKEYLPAGSYQFSIEEKPLGTGGAIYKASGMIRGAEAIVLNADTYFGVSFMELSRLHMERKAACTLSLKPLKNFDRYGIVQMDDHQRITGFSEKKPTTDGLINGGVYALSADRFLQKSFPEVFSFEKDYLEKEFTAENFVGLVSEAYFIDIGIPEDFTRAQSEFRLQA